MQRKTLGTVPTPKACGAVCRCSCEVTPIWREKAPQDVRAVSIDLLQRVEGIIEELPHVARPLVARRHQYLSVWSDAHTAHGYPLFRDERTSDAVRFQVPYEYPSLLIAGYELHLVRVEVDRMYRDAVMAANILIAKSALLRTRVPNPDGAIL